MTRIFIDSDVLVALNDKDDPSHLQAQQRLNEISGKEYEFISSTNVLLESVTIISQRVGKKEGVTLLNELRSGKYTVIHPDDSLIVSSEEIFRSIVSKNVSYSDCVSFAVMRRFGIRWVFSFDLHFKKQGFKRVGIDR